MAACLLLGLLIVLGVALGLQWIWMPGLLLAAFHAGYYACAVNARRQVDYLHARLGCLQSLFRKLASQPADPKPERKDWVH